MAHSLGRRVVHLLMTLVFALPILGLGDVAASAVSAWSTTSPKLETLRTLAKGETPPYSMDGNRDCHTVPTPYGSGDKTASCIVDTVYGAVAPAGLFRIGTEYYGDVRLLSAVGQLAPVLPIPGSSTLLYATGGYAGAGAYFNYVDDANTHLHSQLSLASPPTTHVLDTRGLPLADASGKKIPLEPGSVAFSQNGQWLVADSVNNGLVRVNTITKEIVAFGKSFDYNIGIAPGAQMAISEDGRYVAVSSIGMARFELYDLASCGPMPTTFGSSPAFPTPCSKVDLLPKMQQLVSGYMFSSRLRFVDSNTLTLYSSVSVGGVRSTLQQVLYTGDQPSYIGMQYLSLGDSYSSGEGAYAYKATTDTPDNRCHVSQNSYPYLLAIQLQLTSAESVACSGAVMDDLYDTSGKTLTQPQSKGMSGDANTDLIYGSFLAGYRQQVTFAQRYKPSVITLTAGGNDVGFQKIIQRCLSADTCYSTYEDRLELATMINGKFSQLTGLYSKLKQTALPTSRIYVAGYPSVAAENGNCALNVHLNNDEIVFANQLVDYLNSVISAAAANTGVGYVDVRDALAGHRLCEAETDQVAVNGLTAGNGFPSWLNGPFASESYHPNALGHTLLAQAFRAQTADFSSAMPVANSTSLAPGVQTSMALLQLPANHRGVNLVAYTTPDSTPFIAGQTVGLNVSVPVPILSPATAVDIWINSTPVRLGTATTRADGSFGLNTQLPADIEPGFHTIHAYGSGVTGKAVDVQMVVYVSAAQNDYSAAGQAGDPNACGAFTTSTADADADGLVDACDPMIGPAPVVLPPPVEPTPPSPTTPPDTSQPPAPATGTPPVDTSGQGTEQTTTDTPPADTPGQGTGQTTDTQTGGAPQGSGQTTGTTPAPTDGTSPTTGTGSNTTGSDTLESADSEDHSAHVCNDTLQPVSPHVVQGSENHNSPGTTELHHESELKSLHVTKPNKEETRISVQPPTSTAKIRSGSDEEMHNKVNATVHNATPAAQKKTEQRETSSTAAQQNNDRLRAKTEQTVSQRLRLISSNVDTKTTGIVVSCLAVLIGTRWIFRQRRYAYYRLDR